MTIQEIAGEDYRVHCDTEAATIQFQGELALRGPKEYAGIIELLNQVIQSSSTVITLDLRNLDFLNSSGISVLSKFVLSLRKQKGTQLVVLGSNKIPWQKKSLRNLQKFLPSLKLEIV